MRFLLTGYKSRKEMGKRVYVIMYNIHVYDVVYDMMYMMWPCTSNFAHSPLGRRWESAKLRRCECKDVKAKEQ